MRSGLYAHATSRAGLKQSANRRNLPASEVEISPYTRVERRRFGAQLEGFTMRYNPDEDRRLTIRLEDDLRDVLTVEARRQMRSLCSEIKFRLRQSLERQDEATA